MEWKEILVIISAGILSGLLASRVSVWLMKKFRPDN